MTFEQKKQIVIDNSFKVDCNINMTLKEAYEKGFNRGLSKVPKPKVGQPQGEWIKVKEERMSVDMSGEIVTGYKCSICGRYIVTLPSKLADYPFCHCGADMRKGSVE